jgi:hypothetical protein
MTCRWCAEAQQIAVAKLVGRAQQMILASQPALVFGDNRRALAINADAKRIAHLLPRPM